MKKLQERAHTTSTNGKEKQQVATWKQSKTHFCFSLWPLRQQVAFLWQRSKLLALSAPQISPVKLTYYSLALQTLLSLTRQLPEPYFHRNWGSKVPIWTHYLILAKTWGTTALLRVPTCHTCRRCIMSPLERHCEDLVQFLSDGFPQQILSLPHPLLRLVDLIAGYCMLL